MACANPFYRYVDGLHSYVRIPCGWCLACRIDKRNYYRDRFEYSFHKDFNCVGSFTCITYDENHIPLNSDGTAYTLRKQDSVNFIKRVRSYLRDNKINSTFLRQGFKFFAAGEYGGEYGRPHIHYIFCGLDYSAVNDIFRNCWKNGVIIDNKPILKGGINYVMKYLDKQQHGKELDIYFEQNIEPPFMHCSHKMAEGLYKTENPDDLFYTWRGFKRPLPIWIRNSRLLKPDTAPNQNIKDFAVKNNMTYDEASYYLRRSKLLNLEHTTRFHNEPCYSTDGEVSRTFRSLENRFYV